MIRFKLNGVETAYEGDPSLSLLRYLRDEAGITSPKDGCSAQGACGCCTVENDGRAVLSCLTPMEKTAGATVTTVEGLAPRVQAAFADAFSATGASQCGFCSPGIVMRAKCLLAGNPSPTRAEVADSLNQHLCRCTGYVKVLDAILLAAAALRGRDASPAAAKPAGIGARLARLGSRDAVLGRRRFVADIRVPGMLHAALKLGDHPRARVLSIDAGEALRVPGVERVFLAGDVPGQRRHGLITADWPLFVAPGEELRYVGDVLAAVAARDRRTAREAAKLVRVFYEVLPAVTDAASALKDGAPRLHPDGNLLGSVRVLKGDAEEAFRRCGHVVEAIYTTQAVEHGYLEPEACLAAPEGDGVVVHSAGQGVYEDRRQIAALLGLPERLVRVIQAPTGGGFGGKEDLLIQGHAALMARLLARPVRLVLSRDESILMHPKRHAMRMEYKLGCSKDGRLLALRARVLADTGAYASVGLKVIERAAGHAAGAYHVPDVDIEARAVHTNNIPAGAMRGFGVNQVTFAMESAVDELCAKGGFDRWRFRHDNALADGLETASGQVLSSGVGVRATLEAVRDVFRKARRAGIACGMKNTGAGGGADAGEVKVKVNPGGEVEVVHGWCEMGQGVDTVAVQVVCQELGLPPSAVRVSNDTAEETPCGMTTASRATSLLGNSLIAACRALKEDLKASPLASLASREYRGRWSAPAADRLSHYSYSYATQVVLLDAAGRVREVVAAHDAGRVVNPALFEGQIQGAIHMGLGYALTEELELRDGRPVSTRLRDCGILRAREMPKVTVIPVEVPDAAGPYGAKGVGEIGLVPTAAAVANALFAHDGVRRRALPMMRRRLAR